MIRILSFKWFLLTIPIVISASANQVGAQSIGFNIGWYHSINPASYSSPWDFALDQKPSISFELYFRNILNSNRASRFGIRAFFLSVRRKPVNPSEVNLANRDGYKYRMSSFLFSYQRKIYNKDLFYLMLNLSAGLSFRKYENLSGASSCEVPFCTLPDASFSFQPGLYCILKVYKNLVVQINGRYNFLTADKKDFYPFSSGLLFEGGLLLEMPICR